MIAIGIALLKILYIFLGPAASPPAGIQPHAPLVSTFPQQLLQCLQHKFTVTVAYTTELSLWADTCLEMTVSLKVSFPGSKEPAAASQRQTTGLKYPMVTSSAKTSALVELLSLRTRPRWLGTITLWNDETLKLEIGYVLGHKPGSGNHHQSACRSPHVSSIMEEQHLSRCVLRVFNFL